MKDNHSAIINRDHPRVKGFAFYLKGRGVTERGIKNILSFAANYRVSAYLKDVLPQASTVYDTADVKALSSVYGKIRDDEDNIRLHRIYSGAVNRYIEFLSGKRVGRETSKKKSD